MYTNLSHLKKMDAAVSGHLANTPLPNLMLVWSLQSDCRAACHYSAANRAATRQHGSAQLHCNRTERLQGYMSLHSNAELLHGSMSLHTVVVRRYAVDNYRIEL